MRRRGRAARAVAILLAAGLLAAGCAATEPFDYGPYLAHMPRSIVVLPPANASVEPQATYNYLSTVTAPLAEMGYYVFPVALIDAMLKENGLPTPAEMHTARLDRIRQVIGADAVLYLSITGWGTSYQVINSQTTVSVEGRLVDTATGLVIWSGAHTAVEDSSAGQSDAIGMLVGALVNQILATAGDQAHALAGPAAATWFGDQKRGLLLGPRHPRFAEQQAGLREGRAD